eukprot:comp21546_c0_seq1/m.47186 comp21546_c0_seq1/g.47186  ORF comp21546_c0_seq1/g.47186 comp21546_c0_seq1/m.47186 type:complete len:462 (+) comp21546_c0_seq1:15-1400(+)
MSASLLFEGNVKTILVMVGLPARGKSYISQKLRRYLQWLGKKCRVHNVGDKRRAALGPNHDYHFFLSENEEAVRLREEFAKQALYDLRDFLQHGGGDVAIFDATNTTRARRDLVNNFVEEELRRKLGLKVNVIFIESICTDETVIQANLERKLENADYEGIDRESAMNDFRLRLDAYAKVYQPLVEEHLSFIKIYNVTGKLEAQNIHGYLPSQLVFFLLNLHLKPREVYMSRHGQSVFNLYDRLGGDSNLCEAGVEYAHRLGAWLRDNHDHSRRPMVIWCSTLNRAVTTANIIKDTIHDKGKGPLYEVLQFHVLNEINAGICEGMSYEEVREKMPDVYSARSEDKLRFRYPSGGESYLDLIDRLQPLIIELERVNVDVVVIAHQAVVRVLLSYFQDTEPENCPYVEVPLHQFVKITGQGHTKSLTWTSLGPPAQTLDAMPLDSSSRGLSDITPLIHPRAHQ